MMEEIDRFQVPTAHSEMQPLVRGRAAGGGQARAGRGRRLRRRKGIGPRELRERLLGGKESLEITSLGRATCRT